MKPSMIEANREFKAAMEMASVLGYRCSDAIDYANEATKALVGVDVMSFNRTKTTHGPIHLGRVSWNDGQTAFTKNNNKAVIFEKPEAEKFSPSKLAAMIGCGLDARKVNKILLKIGFQNPVKITPYRHRPSQWIVGYTPTEKGSAYAVTCQLGNLPSSTRWLATVIPHICKVIDN